MAILVDLELTGECVFRTTFHWRISIYTPGSLTTHRPLKMSGCESQTRFLTRSSSLTRRCVFLSAGGCFFFLRFLGPGLSRKPELLKLNWLRSRDPKMMNEPPSKLETNFQPEKNTQKKNNRQELEEKIHSSMYRVK